MEQWTGSKLGKEYVKAVYYHPAYLTYMHSTSCEKLGWMKHKLESRLLGEITNSDMQMTPLMAESEEEPKSLLMKRGEWKNWLKTQYSKMKIRHSVPSFHAKAMGKKWKQWQTSFLGAPKSLQVVTATTKLKDTWSLEVKLWQT